jgi:hypothetical protein
MSYLDAVRLHFAGQFQADPSTVNNVTQYYNNATFEKKNQKPPFGLWNPEGGSAWRLVECRVTRVCYADGTSTANPNEDPVVGLRIADTNKRVAGKLVDLDPEQQMVSEIWSLLVRLTDGEVDSFSGPFATAAFTDLWLRAMEKGRPRQQPLCAVYQSVIGPVAWGDMRNSRFLRELREAAAEDMLSIKFNVDGYDRDNTIPTFTLGRIVGSIGPAHAGEPRHFVLGRHLGGTEMHLNYFPCVVDTAAKRLTADFGNAIATTKPGGPLMNIGDLALNYVDPNSGNLASVGAVTYREPGWYESTAGVQAFPLSDAALSAIGSTSLYLTINGSPALQENVDGVYVRADQFVYRLSPSETANVELYATQYGALQDGAQIVVEFDPSQIQQQVGPGDPAVATPLTAITGFDPSTPIVAANGRATLQLTAHDPGNPRGYVDGQVYGVRPVPQAVTANPGAGWINPADFISILVWDAFDAPAPTWHGEMAEIFTQYGNLYPLMDKLIDLTSYDAVVARKDLLKFAFGLPVEDPNSMPVTRDLSPAKRAAILRWLDDPQLGTPPPPPQETAASVAFVAEAAAAEAPAAESAPEPPKSRLFQMKSGRTPEEL